ncbi:ROK family protein [Luteolibacter marinus]|uniref:ROK family protein n=1 Tax=Luteolibacter marinus TaxID=2776705 RepID=UPI001866B815|nr:ROK family protein [Luteolibacter marinus]
MFPPLERSSIFVPELDPEFRPASLWCRDFDDRCRLHGSRDVAIRLTRPDGTFTTHRETLLPPAPEWRELNLRHLERIIKFLLWARGGNRVSIAGAPELCEDLRQIYSKRGARAFDADFIRKVFSAELVIEAAASLPDHTDGPSGASGARGVEGCRIGFDLGGSDRKCAALIDGKVVFSEEIAWDPYFEKDPAYHFDGIMDSLRRAAAHLPRIDAIGGSAAGVYVNNRVRVASLFRGVPEEMFKSRVEEMFLDIAREWNDVPLKVVNDGDVTALAGSMSLGSGGVLGIAMGTSTAAGYVDASGSVTNWLSELAFVPVDYRDQAPADEWSGDRGCSVQYFSQQGVSRLIPAAGLDIDTNQPQREQLVEVQQAMAAGDERAAALYRTLGTCFGYAIPHYARFYDIKHLLLLGRVLSGEGGEILLDQARTVLREEFPTLSAGIEISTPDETMKRHGQAIAAASLPVIPS